MIERPVDDSIFDRMVSIRRDLHRHPELGWQEERSAERICEVLSELQIPHRRLCDTGVVAEIPGSIDLPCVALRADIDALPIQEQTGLPFASVNDGVMHACGHDGHTSMLLGAAELLAADDGPEAPVRLIFQPAEEGGGGAERLIEAGVLDDVAVIFGGHVDRRFPVGTLLVTPGVVNASTDWFNICITGRGGHAGRPHEAVDAVVLGSLMVMAFQTIVSREIDPGAPSVISIGKFHSGSAANAIAERAEIEGTIRAHNPEVRAHLRESLERIAISVAASHGAEVEVALRDGAPPVENSAEMAALSREAAAAVVPDRKVWYLRQANMGAEDFSHYLRQVPGCYIRIGAQLPGRKGFPAHSSRFDFNEEALGYGAAWFRQMSHVAARAIRDGEIPEVAGPDTD